MNFITLISLAIIPCTAPHESFGHLQTGKPDVLRAEMAVIRTECFNLYEQSHDQLYNLAKKADEAAIADPRNPIKIFRRGCLSYWIHYSFPQFNGKPNEAKINEARMVESMKAMNKIDPRKENAEIQSLFWKVNSVSPDAVFAYGTVAEALAISKLIPEDNELACALMTRTVDIDRLREYPNVLSYMRPYVKRYPRANRLNIMFGSLLEHYAMLSKPLKSNYDDAIRQHNYIYSIWDKNSSYRLDLEAHISQLIEKREKLFPTKKKKK